MHMPFADMGRGRLWWGGVGMVLLVALLGTWGVRWAAIQDVKEDPNARRTAVVNEAFSTIETRFHALQAQVRARAEALATDSVVIRGLHSWKEEGERSTELFRHVLDASFDDYTSVEVYSPLPRVVAWNGPRMPLGEAPDEEAFLKRPQTEVVADGTVRRALVVWWPVRTSERVVGAVRVVRTVRFQPPVKNRYIQGFDLQDEWAQATGESIRLTWSEARPDPESPYRLLRDPQGDVLGYVTLTPPSPDRLVQRTASFYDDLIAGWMTLLLGWGVGLLGLWYVRLVRRPGVRRCPRARAAATGRFALLALLWGGARYALLGLDVPGRWVDDVELFTTLFDPTRFASTIGGGIFRSIGDLFLTGLWTVLLAAGALHLALRYRLRAESVHDFLRRLRTHEPSRPSPARFFGAVVGVLGISLGSILALAYVVRRVVLDGTLDFFSRTGLLPEPLMFVVLCALFLLVAAVGVLGVACGWIGLRLMLRYRPRWPSGFLVGGVLVLCVAGVALPYLLTDVQALVPLLYPIVMIGAMGATIVYGSVGRNGGAEAFTLRGLLLGLFVVTLLVYPLLYEGMDAQRRERMVEAARSFEEGYDPRALYSIRQVLRTAAEEMGPVLSDAAPLESPRTDSVAAQLLRQSLLASLTSYEVSLSLFDADRTLQQRYGVPGRQSTRTGPSQADRRAFEVLHQGYDPQLSPGPVIDQITSGRGGPRTEQLQYAGLLWMGEPEEGDGYWVLVRAEPRSLLPGTGPGVPRVLLPDGSFSDLYAELALAEFQDGTLVRSFGRHFGHTRLSAAPDTTLDQHPTQWHRETVRGRQYLTYYTRSSPEEGTASTVAVRIPALLAFDHLYYMLRLTVAGLGVAILVYLLGLYGRYRHGLVPARRVRFRNKVLNAFLIAGIVSMVAVGVVGVQVVTGENERIVERQLNDQLARVEETLALEARPQEPLWQVADRVDIDSLAARSGLDLRVYEDGQLIGTSRPRLVRDGLVDERLPGAVYHELYDEARRVTSAEATIGTFRYRVGYQALADEEGRPRLVVGVPTLAQQEQLAEEQARTLAYLFGALLVLVVVVMLTAVVLASALAQPIARLREGLEAVGKGQFAQALPVDTRDEIGDLVQTFNEMRAQLAESRRKLAQQERETAWREMARQVAHEIKNPLTPMKLSIQHLRRAFKRRQADGDGETDEFAPLFDRITTTLIEQIESLVRIANEFSTFARLPTRVLETLDLNEVVEEAVRLMERETESGAIELDLSDEPLPVEADREELRRIYINLLKNALQAIPDDREGHVRVVTAVRGESKGEDLEAYSRVIDNGTGIPPDVQDKIFEPNFSTKTGGTGLGLAIAQQSISELGGDIGYETEEGEGTTFWIRLPMVEEAHGESG